MMGLPPRDRTTDRIVAHSWDDTVVPTPCLPTLPPLAGAG
ncbi:MAG: hypothetical protein RLZZ338_520, partial [Cyanobacteriota bacterium]